MYTPKSFTPDNTSSASGYMPKSFTPNNSSLQTQQPLQQKGAPLWMKYLFPAVGQQVGTWGGRALGAMGGALVPGADLTGIPEVAGGYAGGVGGAGAGSAAGTGLYDLVDKAMGGQGNDNVGQSAAWGAGGQAVGGPIAKLTGATLHPLQTLVEGSGPIQGLSKTVAKATGSVDMQPILDAIQNRVAPAAVRSGLGVQGQKEIMGTLPPLISAIEARQNTPITGLQGVPQTFENLISNPDMSSGTIKGVANLDNMQYRRMGGVAPGEAGPPGYLKAVSFKNGSLPTDPNAPLMPNSNLNNGVETFGDINNMHLPVSEAYGLKADYQDLVNNSGGYGNNPLTPTTQGQKAIAQMLRNQVHQASPFNPLQGQLGIQGYDKLLNEGYKAQGLMNILGKIPGIGGPLNTLLGLPLATAQKIVPQSGGAWNYINPILGNLFGTATRTANQ